MGLWATLPSRQRLVRLAPVTTPAPSAASLPRVHVCLNLIFLVPGMWAS